VSVLSVFNVATEWYTDKDGKRAATGRMGSPKSAVTISVEQKYPQILERFPAKARREHVCDAIAVWLAAKNGVLARL
jgi:hypothetical protein